MRLRHKPVNPAGLSGSIDFVEKLARLSFAIDLQNTARTANLFLLCFRIASDGEQ
jgi:hypothetical protein